MAVPEMCSDSQGQSAAHSSVIQNGQVSQGADVSQCTDVSQGTDISQDERQMDTSSTQTDGATTNKLKPRETWGRKLEFLFTAVGFAVGLGNVWRFPHLCYKNGGGAFLIPYLLMLGCMGLPLFYLELAFGQYASLGPLTIWRVCPLFKGLGYAMFAISTLVSIYYNVLIGYTLFYFFASFQSPVPWSDCTNWWNTAACSLNRHAVNITQLEATTDSDIAAATNNMTVHNASDILELVSPAQEYWEYRVLGLTKTTNIANIGGLRWHVTLCLLLSWIIVFLCIMKGIKSSGKVAYFTASFPYVVLFILFIRGVTLEGAAQGIIYYLKPDFHKMASVVVWKEAAVQILYSLGVGSGAVLTMGSFNKFHNNCQRDALVVSLINCGTSVFAGFVIFSVLGHMAHEAGVEVADVAKKVGPGLAFVVYPEGLALMSGAPFWSFCFFFMLFILGLGSQGGMYVIDLFDKFSTAFPLLFTVLFEVIVLNWIYGFKKFTADIEHMIGFKPNYYWICSWVLVTPAVVMFILVFSCIQYDGITLEGYRYPNWAEGIGWLLSLASLLCIPVWMIIKVVLCIGTCRNLRWVMSCDRSISSLNLKSLITPSHEWGPALQQNRVGRDPEIYGRLDEHTTDTAISQPAEVLYKSDGSITINGTTMYGTDTYI
ncbi:hypothetical protein LSH36_151g05026 [Paralvinella palmiformis]|uniref:Transporter n=1 Tax=Paralvinella palmiformis TaxID=53620 RepID=A0AAD9JUH4_9ANNE|nr:hypothetical protein LSH36_151g05026 [Paralvinella palmiformis]